MHNSKEHCKKMSFIAPHSTEGYDGARPLKQNENISSKRYHEQLPEFVKNQETAPQPFNLKRHQSAVGQRKAM